MAQCIARNGGSIERSTISDNFAIRFAGGLTQEGNLELRNSTVSGNVTAQDDGGGLRVRQVTSIRVINSTIAGNHAGSHGGGISFIDNALPSTLVSSLVSGNSSASGADDVYSSMSLQVSGSHNLVMQDGGNVHLPADTLTADPLLLPLADNGGATLTHALPLDSPAIDQGENPDVRATDQRGTGYLREYNGRADIGAYEYQGNSALALPLDAWSQAATWILAGLLALAAGLRRQTQRPVRD